MYSFKQVRATGIWLAGQPMEAIPSHFLHKGIHANNQSSADTVLGIGRVMDWPWTKNGEPSPPFTSV
jgi:hypothetical protein